MAQDIFNKQSPSGNVTSRFKSTNGPPGVLNDKAHGFTQFSQWIDELTGFIYECVDTANGAAIWNLISGGGAAESSFILFGVNSAGAELEYDPKSLVLRTGSGVNPAGAFNGGGTGNKAIGGKAGLGMPIGSLLSISYTWENLLGPGGVFYNPPTAASVTVPFCNLVVDFDPLGAGDLRILSLMDSQLALAISTAIGTYSNPGGLNIITHSWTSAMDVLIVLAPPNPVPGGVPVNVSVGPGWPENSYQWSALVAANPTAILVDAFPATIASPTGDGGMPVGAIIPSIVLVSGDSGNIVKSGKQITAFSVNGNVLIP